jgi:hypothetical protein
MTRRSALGCGIAGDHRLHFALSERYVASRSDERSEPVCPDPLLHEHAVERCDQRLDATRMGVPEPIRRGLVQYACVQSIEIELTERGAGTPRRVESRQSGEFTVALQGTEAPHDRKLSVTNCSPAG